METIRNILPDTRAYLHAHARTPDPTYGKTLARRGDGLFTQAIFPHGLLAVCEPNDARKCVRQWAQRCDLHTDPGALDLRPDKHGIVDVLLDFGTELNGILEVALTAERRCYAEATFGESVEEALGYVSGRNPDQKYSWVIQPGSSRERMDRTEWEWEFLQTRNPMSRGFRFVRIRVFNATGPFVIDQIYSDAEFFHASQEADFVCSDVGLQRAWQTTVYSARLCARPDTIWDGIKRDRVGWMGDGRYTNKALMYAYPDPHPALSLLSVFPTDSWSIGVPLFSFEGVGLLYDLIERYGTTLPGVQDIFERIKQFFAWVAANQTNPNGFVVRDEELQFFGDIGFLDWSNAPVGGRFEELSWLQIAYAGALRTAARIGSLLSDHDTARQLEYRSKDIWRKIMHVFRDESGCFVHTLNHVGAVDNPYTPNRGGHYVKSYKQSLGRGPSGPSRQANSRAILTGLCSPEHVRTMLTRVLYDPAIPRSPTPMSVYIEQCARATAGDASGAFHEYREYMVGMCESEDATSIWEVYDPQLAGEIIRLYSHRSWGYSNTLSLCHGWGGAFVDFIHRHVLGIFPTAPGYASVSLSPLAEMPFSFDYHAPTPYGPIRATRQDGSSQIIYHVPHAIRVDESDRTDCVVVRSE